VKNGLQGKMNKTKKVALKKQKKKKKKLEAKRKAGEIPA